MHGKLKTSFHQKPTSVKAHPKMLVARENYKNNSDDNETKIMLKYYKDFYELKKCT